METTQDDLVRAMITAGVTDERLIEAFRTILRDEFVPENARTSPMRPAHRHPP